MTDPRDHQPLSRIELIVLARLSVPKAVTKDEIARSLRELGVPFTEAALADCVTATLSGLEARTLVAAAPHSSKRKVTAKARKPPPRFVLTERGRLALREALELAATPSWTEMRERVIPTLALGAKPGPQANKTALSSEEAMTATLLRRDPMLGEPTTVAQLCDQVIARALGMPPGAVTLAGIRAFALAMHCGIDSKAELERIATRFAPTRQAPAKQATRLDRELKALAATFARQRLRADFKNKQAMIQTLRRHWVSQQDEADDPRKLLTPWSTPLQPELTGTTGLPTDTPLPQHGGGGEILLAVREAIPMVGSAGRYGKDNVFVSALWQQLAGDRRLPQLSLAGFKRWLVTANRDQLVALARADLVDDMDARLVEDSEIEDLGATFHFVIDRQATSGPGQVHHAR